MVVKISGKAILLIIAGTGMVLSAVFAAKNAPEAQKRKEEALQKKREETGNENAQLTFVESAKAQFGSYAPAVVAGIFAMGGLVGSEVVNKQNLNKAKKTFSEFKDMTEQLGGAGSVKAVEKAVEQKKLDEKTRKPWEEKEQFRIVFQGHSIQFESTRADVMAAIYEINRYFHDRGQVTFNDFLKYLGQNSVEEGDDRGWESYVGESIYGYSWIDIGLKECIDEPWITEIYMACYPHFFNEDECENEIENCGTDKLISGGEEWIE